MSAVSPVPVSTGTARRARPCLVVLAAPPGPLTGVRDALQDWSALGLVSPFVWVDCAAADQPPGQLGAAVMSAQRIEGGRAFPAVLEDVVEDQPFERIRLGILVPALRAAAPLPPTVEDRLVRLIRSAGGGVPLDRLRFVLTRPDSGPGTGCPARPEWHNLVLSPEDGQGPGLGRVQLMPSLDAIELGAPAAAAICAVSGLWTGLPGGPLDGESPMPGETVRVVRAFHRRLDAGAIEDQVRAGVAGTGHGLPRPRTGGTRSVPSDDPDRDSAQMVAAFWRRHAAVLDSGRLEAEPVPVEPIRIGEALRMFLQFLAATLVNAVPRWYHATVHKISSDVARATQHALFGTSPAAYTVMVKGVRADNEPADWRDLVVSSQQLEDALASHQLLAGGVQSGRAVLATLWRDFVGAALTLADAGDHAGELPPLQRGIDRAFVEDPAAIAPGADAAFAGLPPYLSSAEPGLRPTDVLAVEAAALRLSQLAQQPGGAADADRVASALQDWSASHAGAFTVQVGTRLGAAVKQHTATVQDLLARLAEAARADELDSELQRKQRRLATLIWVLLGLLVVVLGVDVVLGVNAVVEPLTAVLIGAGAVGVWLAGTAATFIKQQQNLFAELHRRRQAASDAEINQRNLAIALGDLRRTSQAYGELLQWSRAVAVVLAEPFGKQADSARSPMIIGAGMPRSVRVGVARPDDPVLTDVVDQLRTERYRFGWLGPIWDAVLADAHRRLGPAARELREDPALLYGQPPGPDSLLTRWADLLEADGPGSTVGDALWADTLAKLEDTPLGDSLLTEVVPADGGKPRSLADFMAGIGSDVSPSSTELDYAVFRRHAQVAGKASVDRTYGRTSRAGGLAKAAVSVQFSTGIPAYDLSWAPQSPAPDPRDAPTEAHGIAPEFNQDF